MFLELFIKHGLFLRIDFYIFFPSSFQDMSHYISYKDADFKK